MTHESPKLKRKAEGHETTYTRDNEGSRRMMWKGVTIRYAYPIHAEVCIYPRILVWSTGEHHGTANIRFAGYNLTSGNKAFGEVCLVPALSVVIDSNDRSRLKVTKY